MFKPALEASLLLTAACACGLAQQANERNGARTVEIGFEQRVRNENWNNILDFNEGLDDERQQIRYRTRAWLKLPVTSQIDVQVGLNQETNQKLGLDNRFDEVFFETAYLDFKRLFTDGLSLRVGRQNLQKGEGFLLLDGGSGDGSRALYFNGVDLAFTRGKSKIDLLGIFDPHEDRFLPRMHDQHRLLQEWDEQAVGVYFTDNHLARTALETYYFYKKEVNDTRPTTNPQFQPDRHVSTVGARVTQRLTPAWTATGEFAAQWGAEHGGPTHNGARIGGSGGYGYLKRTFGHPWKPYAQAGYWGFSGDDPKTTDQIEGWDPLFSRWPKWSELYIYSQVRERGVGYWTNLGMWQAEAGFVPSKYVAGRFTYYHMDAFQPFRGDSRIFGAGTGRGDNVQARVDFTIGPNWKAHALYESHLPGDFYSAGRTGYFLRFEISYLVRATTRLGEH